MLQETRARRAVLLGLAIGWPLLTGYQVPEPGKGTLVPGAVASPLAIALVTDCGVEMDDQWALAHLLLSQEIVLRAVVTTHASSRLLVGSQCQEGRRVIAPVPPATGPPLPPVVPGSDSPLRELTTPSESPGVDTLLELSRAFSPSRRLVVLATGAGTDVASAILKDPSIVDRVSVVAMGFDDWPGGGDGFNVKNDPLAWRIILDSTVRVPWHWW
jgi:inosine-uridine nucleoside N-ribohydrolase